MIGRRGDRGSGISVLAARHDDDDDEMMLKLNAFLKENNVNNFQSKEKK